MDRWSDVLTFGFLVGTYSVRKSCQENISTQQIPDIFLRNEPHFEFISSLYANEVYSTNVFKNCKFEETISVGGFGGDLGK